MVLATGDPGSAAAVATARAAGATVVLTDGQTDPRGSTAAIDALAGSDSGPVVALGAGFGAEQGLDWKLATASTGTRLPGGGQLLFPGRMLVALYGHPGTGALGVLGEQGLDASIQRARTTAAQYDPLVDVPVVPAFEIIATVASSSAGADGNYSSEADPEELRPWVEAAAQAGVYVVLDLQPGRTDFLTQAKEYQSLLELPNVGLALDPEWRLGPNQVHLTQIGSVGIDEVNSVVTWLADLTREHALPQKLLVLHQFRVDMIPGRERLDTSRDELAVMVHADGQGSQGAKQATWARLHENAPAPLWWGWKNFYDEDAPDAHAGADHRPGRPPAEPGQLPVARPGLPNCRCPVVCWPPTDSRGALRDQRGDRPYRPARPAAARAPARAHRLLLPDARLVLRRRGRGAGDDGPGLARVVRTSRGGRRCGRGSTGSRPTSASTSSPGGSAGRCRWICRARRGSRSSTPWPRAGRERRGWSRSSTAR